MNTAVALGTLGADCQFLGRLSTDEFGQQLRDHIEDAQVGLDLAITTDELTSIAVVSLDKAGKATYAFHFGQTANFGWRADELPHLASTDWLHIASLATLVRPGAEVLLEWLDRTEAPVSYDINVRSSVVADPVEYWSRVEPWLRAVGRRGGVVKASDDDIDFLTTAGVFGGTAVEVAARWVQEFDLGLAVVTQGPEGATALLPGNEGAPRSVSVDGFDIELVDTVGAGDTFMAGFLEAYVDTPDDLEAALRRGAAASAIVCSRRGAQPPTAAEVDALLKE